MSNNTDSAADLVPENKPEAINASCRLPVLFLFFSAAIWVVQASAVGVLGSLSMQIPGFLPDLSYLTYGRLQANAWVAFLFGFGGNAGLGLTLWMLSRLRGMELARPGFVVAGAVLWNVGVTAAMVGITMGDQPGVPGYELPAYAGRVLFVGHALIAFSAVLTYFSRRHKQLYPSSWYLIASLVAFPWILGTAHWLLVENPVRGAAQIPAAHWAATSLQQVWLGSMGLAALIYFIPKITQRELHSRQWAGFGFWMLLILGGWVNLNSGSPIPVWSIKLSQLASLLYIFVLVAVCWNLLQTAKGVPLIGSKDLTLKFMGASFASWALVAFYTFGNVFLEWNNLLQFTYAATAMRHVFAWGFFGMAMFGAIYYVAPRLFGNEVDWACSGIYKWVFYSTGFGVVVVALAGMYFSYGHGHALQGSVAADVLAKKALMPMRIAFFGELAFFAGSMVFLSSMACLLFRNCCGECSPMSIIRQCRAAESEGGAE